MQRAVQFIRHSLIFALALACLFSVLAFWGDWNSFLDLASHFRWFYFWIELAGLLALLMAKAFRWALLTALFLAVNSSQFLPFYQVAPAVSTLPAHQFRVLQFNTWASNQHPERIAALIAKAKPDLVALEELTDENYDYLNQQSAMRVFPVKIRQKKDRLLLLSRYPLMEKPALSFFPAGMGAKIQMGSKPIVVVMAHTFRPIGDYAQYQKQMERLGKMIVTLHAPIVVMGDLNTGPWSASFKRLLKHTRLHNTQLGFGVEPTYPCYLPKTQIPMPLPILPLDHVLVSNEFMVLKRWNGMPSGSDHLPVLVDLGLLATGLPVTD